MTNPPLRQGGTPAPLPSICYPTLPFPPKSPDQNFDITILFTIVETFSSHAFGDKNPPPHCPWRRSLSYKICQLFKHVICYWEISIYFLGAGGGNFSLEVFYTSIFWGVSFSGEILQGNLPEFLYKNLSYFTYIFFADSILRVEMLR